VIATAVWRVVVVWGWAPASSELVERTADRIERKLAASEAGWKPGRPAYRHTVESRKSSSDL
jgi:hypothetical protein